MTTENQDQPPVNPNAAPSVVAGVEEKIQEIKDLFARYGSGDYEPTEAEKEIIDAGLLNLLGEPRGELATTRVLQNALRWLLGAEHQSRSCHQPFGAGYTPCICGLANIREGIQAILSSQGVREYVMGVSSDEEIAREASREIWRTISSPKISAPTPANTTQVIFTAIRKAKSLSTGASLDALEAMADALSECAEFLVSIKPQVSGDTYFRYQDILRNVRLIHDLQKSGQLNTLTRGTFVLGKAKSLSEPKERKLRIDDVPGGYNLMFGDEKLLHSIHDNLLPQMQRLVQVFSEPKESEEEKNVLG